ncbi:hypothetical protein [Nodosilinea sp. E11]|uniref:hypothetical protein n=1 Tax=Nodosilinea sp. E11 TaxID=3037479 RepID=UPI0029349E85|nr:hypothetical protein [Nodosilinea sp. E11]WOD41150.1 hypothetical protein RRF56_10135 [Nodosilinea sp. E11]
MASALRGMGFGDPSLGGANAVCPYTAEDAGSVGWALPTSQPCLNHPTLKIHFA